MSRFAAGATAAMSFSTRLTTSAPIFLYPSLRFASGTRVSYCPVVRRLLLCILDQVLTCGTRNKCQAVFLFFSCLPTFFFKQQRTAGRSDGASVCLSWKLPPLLHRQQQQQQRRLHSNERKRSKNTKMARVSSSSYRIGKKKFPSGPAFDR